MNRLPANAKTMWRLIERDLTVQLVAEELWAPDADSPAADAAQHLRDHGFDVCGVTRDRRVGNWAGQGALSDVATCEDAMQPIEVEQLTAETTPLWEVLESVTKQGRLFVITSHGVTGIVTTADLNKQPVRLLIFGLVSLLEMVMVSMIRTYHPGESWTELISSSRLDTAKRFLDERRRQKQEIDLIDCLKFGDKTCIFVKTGEIADGWEMSKAAIQRRLRDAQKLRDHLAHSQRLPALDTWGETVALLRTMDALTRKGILLLDRTEPE